MSTPFARAYAPTTYGSPVARGTTAGAARTRLSSWTLSRGLGFAAQVLFFAMAAGQLRTSELIVSEIAACVLATGVGEALKSVSSPAHPERHRYGRALSEIGLQCAAVVVVLWVATR